MNDYLHESQTNIILSGQNAPLIHGSVSGNEGLSTMMSFLISILANLATIVVVALVIYLFGWVKHRRMLLNFFTGRSSLLPGGNPFLIYISTLNRSPGGLSSVWEFTEARNLQDLFFSLVPGPSGNPGLFRDFMVSGVDCEIQA